MNDLRVNDLFAMEPLDDVFRGFLRPWGGQAGQRAPQIKLDVSETEANYTVKAEIPGVRKEDIDVHIEGSQVTIGAELKKEREEKKDGRVLRSERQFGWASRSFTLASAVDESKSNAKYQDGVLELTLPKLATTSSRRLPIA